MLENRSSTINGTIAFVICAFLWSIAGLFIKFIDWNPFLIAGTRSLIAFIFLLSIIKIKKIKWSWAHLGGGIANSATMLLFVIANKHTTAANAILLQYLAPVFTSIFGLIILKEKIYKQHIIAIITTIVGLIILFSDRLSSGQLLGNILALISAVTFAFMFIFTRMQKEGRPLESFLLSHLITTIIAYSVSAFLPFPKISTYSITSILVLGILQIGLAQVFFSYGIKRIQAASANILTIIEPVFNPFWVFLFLGEKPSINTIIGGLIILSSVTVTSLVNIRMKK